MGSTSVINQIFRGLGDKKMLIPRSSFAAIAEGPDLLSDETEKNSRARNISFELEMAASLARNFSPKFESQESLGDLCVEVNGCRVPIECKRPYCSLGRSAKDGFSQLRKRYSSESDRGMLANSATKEKKKNPAAVALGRLGGSKGGHARARNMSAKERSESARKAVLARWKKAKAS